MLGQVIIGKKQKRRIDDLTLLIITKSLSFIVKAKFLHFGGDY